LCTEVVHGCKHT